jgi:methyl-accepting chemotaxis protein
MKIRAKLIVLAFGVVALIFAAAGIVYFTLVGTIGRINEERGCLIVLGEAMRGQLIELGKLPYSPMKTSVKDFARASAKVDEAFVGLGGVKTLRRLSSDLAEAFEVIGNLKELNESRLAKVDQDLDALDADSQGLFYIIDASISYFSIYTYDFKPEKRKLLPEARSRLADLVRDIGGLQLSLSSSVATIEAQSAFVDEEIGKIRVRAIAVAGMILFAVLVLAALVALLMANGIARSIIRIERSIAALKEGDLSLRAEVKSRDEIGALSRNLDLFLDLLSSSLSSIAGISRANIEARDLLIRATREAGGSAAAIESSAASIGERIDRFDARLDDSVGSIGKIADGIDALDEQIAGQSAMVEEATASVTEMLASLGNMSRITERDRGSSEELVKVSERGRSAFEEACARVEEISRDVDVIRNMADVIAEVASRTNLLAMNSAIEAAHAGDAGRGFAVVAEEIRKLAEASSTSSSEIAGSIDVIVERIEEAAKANADMRTAFSAIDSGVREVSMSVSEMHARIEEVKIGCEQILQAMVELQDRSVQVKNGSKSMDEGSGEMKATMSELAEISTEVTSSIAEIGSGLANIVASIRSVSDFAERVGQGSGRLDEAMGRFKLEHQDLDDLPMAEDAPPASPPASKA